MNSKTGNLILLGMVAGAIIGALGGYFLGDVFIHLKFLGTIFLNALKMVVIPLIVSSMIVGVASLGDMSRLGRTAARTLVYFLATTMIAVIIGIILVNLIRPGDGLGGIYAVVPDFVAQAAPSTWSDFIVSLIPANIFAAAAEDAVLPLIIFSLIFGGVLTAIGPKGRPVLDFFESLNVIIMKLVMLVIYFAPIGILGLIGAIVAENSGSLGQIASSMGLYMGTVILGLLIHGLVILPLILWFFTKRNPADYYLNMGQAFATAFTTASSAATLPVTMECVVDRNKVNPKSASFVLPLGTTINMDGTALYEAVAAIFVAQAIGFPLGIGDQVIIFATATLASIGAAAIPHAGMVTMVMVFTAVGLPLEGIGFILAVDWILDRCRTTVNVLGDSIGAAVIAESPDIKEATPAAAPARAAVVSESRKSEPRPRVERSDRPRSRYSESRDSREGREKRSYDSDRPARGERRQKDSRFGGDRRPERRRDERHDERRDDRRDDRRGSRRTPRPERPERAPVTAEADDKKDFPYFPKDTIERELVKVRQKLDDLDGEKGPDKTDTFSIDAGDEITEVSEKPRFEFDEETTVSDRPEEITVETEVVPNESLEPVTEKFQEPAPEASISDDASDTASISTEVADASDSEETGTWGRARRKRPSK